ncbi:MAG: hypothetical protein JNM27_09960 [Leptospirales bacterium]|nr:hypothetical protein [Leptospirales bacterium]
MQSFRLAGQLFTAGAVYSTMPLLARIACCLLIVTSASAQPRRLAVSYVVAHFKQLNGAFIEIEGPGNPASTYLLSDGMVQMSGPICTLLMCGDAACNNCGSDVSILDSNSGAGISLRGSFKGEPIRCAGNEALMNCNPPSMRKIRTAGILRVEDDHGGPIKLVLEVKKLFLLPEGP